MSPIPALVFSIGYGCSESALTGILGQVRERLCTYLCTRERWRSLRFVSRQARPRLQQTDGSTLRIGAVTPQGRNEFDLSKRAQVQQVAS
jgi:hypothetical protein